MHGYLSGLSSLFHHFYLYTSTTLFYHVFWCLGGKLFLFCYFILLWLLDFFGFHMIYIFPLVLLRYNCYTSLHMFKVYNMVVLAWYVMRLWMTLIDLVMKCFLPTSGSRYISLPYLHSEVLDSSTRRVTRWPSVLGWVICLSGFYFLIFPDLLCLPHGGCWADQMR